MFKTGDKIVAKINISWYIRKGTVCEMLVSVTPNYIFIKYPTEDIFGNKTFGNVSAWRYNFTKWEINKNIKVL